MAKPQTKTELLKTHAAELVKTRIFFDAQERPWKIYTAGTDVAGGEPCEVTEYVYANSTSRQIIARKEAYETWDGTWDDLFTVSTK